MDKEGRGVPRLTHMMVLHRMHHATLDDVVGTKLNETYAV